jgi:hypothetical protein
MAIKPNSGESRQNFLSRCIPKFKRDGKSQKQAAAACLAVWRRTPGRARAVELEEDMRELGLRVEPVPTDDDRFAWERRRFYLIARAMIESELSPTVAARLVDGSILSNVIPRGESVESQGPHPGSLHPSESLVWLLMARAETRTEPLRAPLDRRLTSDVLEEVASSYDERFRQAKVIQGHNGPSHIVGRFEPPIGRIRSLEYDGYFLWGLVEHDQFDLFWRVSRGALERSVFVQDQSELDGKPSYLDHLALLWGETPVQPNLPQLDQFVPDPALDEELVRGWARSVDLTNGETETMKDEKNLPKKDDPELKGGVDQLVAGLQRSLTEGFASVLEAVRARSADGKDAGKETPKETGKDSAAPDSAIAEISTQMADVVRAVEKVGTRLDDRDTAAASAAFVARNERVDAELETLTRAFQVTPAAADNWRQQLHNVDLSDEQIDGLLEIARSQSPQADLTRSAVLEFGDDDPVTVSLSPNDFSTPDGVVAHPGQIEILARARALATRRAPGEPEKQAALVRSMLMDGDPELLPSN